MMPKQEYPDFGVHYVEFEESFGDYNFGGSGGRAQLDFENMKFDWAH